MKTKVISVALAAVLLVLDGCGDDDDQARTVSTTAAADPETPQDEDPDENEGGVAMSDVVIQLADLPTGFSVTPAEDDEEEDTEDCFGEDPLEATDPLDEAETEFQQSDFGPFVGTIAARYEDQSVVEDAMDVLADGFQACDGFTEVDEDGAETTYSVSPLSFPSLGDDTFAARMSASSPFGPFTMDIVASRVDGVIVLGFNAGLGGIDSELTKSVMRTMVERAGG